MMMSELASPFALEMENGQLRGENELLRETCAAWEETQREYVEPLAYREQLLLQIVESQRSEIEQLETRVMESQGGR